MGARFRYATSHCTKPILRPQVSFWQNEPKFLMSFIGRVSAYASNVISCSVKGNGEHRASVARSTLSGRQRLFDCEKIPPSEALLRRLAQEIGRMKRREGADLARTGLIGKPTTAGLEDSIPHVEERLCGRAAQAYQDVRIGKLDLALDERQADRGFLRRRRAVA